MRTFSRLVDLQALVGNELGVSHWLQPMSWPTSDCSAARWGYRV